MNQYLIPIFAITLKILCGVALLISVFMMGHGFDGDAVDIGLGFKGLGVMFLAIFCFPTKQHIFYRAWTKRRALLADDVISDVVPPLAPPYQGRVRLDIVVPPFDTKCANSWLGGLPKLPQDVKWPETSSHKDPMLFVAQIAMADLPIEIWGGTGPRSGSLAFFVDPENPQADVAVLNLQGDLIERRYPRPIVAVRYYPILRNNSFAPDEKVAPYLTKWAVRPTQLAERDRVPSPYLKYRDPKNLASEHRKNASLSNPAFLPFNWPTLLHLIATLAMKQNQTIRQYKGHEDNLSDDVLMSVASRQEAASALSDLHSRLNKIKLSDQFTPQLRDTVMGDLENIMVRGLQNAYDDPSGKPRPEIREAISILKDIDISKYYGGFEHLCRAIYASDPEKLPAQVRKAFEPLWKYDASYEVAAMGGQVDISGYVGASTDDVCLIEIPRSEVVGTDWHDLSSLGIFIDPDSLEKGDFSRVRSEISES